MRLDHDSVCRQPDCNGGTTVATGHHLYRHAPIKEAIGAAEQITQLMCRSRQVATIDDKFGLLGPVCALVATVATARICLTQRSHRLLHLWNAHVRIG